MNKILSHRLFRRFGKKALIVYLCWCLVKGLFFLYAGYQVFG
ncbi:MAG TPA: hypothetical protein PLU37_00855 [Chitinophagaceae bacterium]|nr:hypothetical protein [Chitinophagaceae bacterium]HRX93154.1 hypothetical protein [Chitinophagaceae bacterium]